MWVVTVFISFQGLGLALRSRRGMERWHSSNKFYESRVWHEYYLAYSPYNVSFQPCSFRPLQLGSQSHLPIDANTILAPTKIRDSTLP
jgi:hypothetical protein